MYELMILGQLSRRPMHGYLIAKIVGYMTGPIRQVQWGALYPVLSRLTRDGFIRVDDGDDGDPEGRTRKVYAITAAGRERMRSLLLDTESHLAEYDQVFLHKVAHFWQLGMEERRRLCRHYAVYCQQHIDHLERKRELLEEKVAVLTAEQLSDIETVMDHGIERWQLERDWAERLIARQSPVEVM